MSKQALQAAVVAGSVLAALTVLAVAQAQTSATIEFLNPSGHSNVLSDKQDADTAYHLVAWVSTVPPGAVVEFQIQGSSGPASTIGTAARVGTSDTFELSWSIPDALADGAYTLRAILYENTGSGFQEVDRDEQEVVLNQADDSIFDPAAETVELQYPASAGELGLYAPVGGPHNAVFSATPSAGARFVEAFYTLSAPGTEPDWVACGRETVSAASDGLRCTLAEGAAPASVTAVAVTVNDTPAPLPFDPNFTDSGDAHRAVPYDQVPATLTLAPATQRVDAGGDGSFPCSSDIVATVRDQRGRLIADVNVDAHAEGPSDQLAFDTPSTGAPNEAPDQNHSATEPAWDCDAGGFGGPQGDHDRPAAPDTKHTESAGGTDDSGQFSFRLHTDAAGATQVTAWADDDGDDRLCASEAAGAAAIGWAQDAPAPALAPPEVSTCPRPTPTPTASPTPTVSPTPSPSPTVPPSCPGFEGDERNQVVGTPGDDVLVGTSGPDVMCGRGGDDTIRALEGADLVLAGKGADSVRAGRGHDEVRAGKGHDSVRGGRGGDDLYGGRGNDVLRGGRGFDRCRPGPGRDTVRGCER